MDTQEIDLSQYKWNGDFDLLLKARARDSNRVDAQYRWLSEKVHAMNVDDEICVMDICSNPKYYDICVKILCVIIVSLRYQNSECRDYVFNEKYTKVRRVY